MRGIYKEFNKELYDTFDGPAKSAVQVHLTLSGHKVTVPRENYGVDVQSSYLGAVMYHEVEVFAGWQKGNFPFNTGHVPERKYRLVREHTNELLFFWRLRLDYRRALVFSAASLRKRHLTEVPNRIIGKGEYFYNLPVNRGKEFDLLCQ